MILHHSRLLQDLTRDMQPVTQLLVTNVTMVLAQSSATEHWSHMTRTGDMRRELGEGERDCDQIQPLISCTFIFIQLEWHIVVTWRTFSRKSDSTIANDLLSVIKTQNPSQNHAYYHSAYQPLCLTRVGRHFSKVGQSGAIWKLLGIETSVVKGFCSEIPILEDKF